MGARIRFVSPVLIVLGGVVAACTESAGPQLDARGFIDVTVGVAHSCAVTESGQALCWGSDRHSTLGDEASANSSIPVRVGIVVPLVAVSAGATHTCALDGQGGAYCWGTSNFGQLGNGTNSTLATPVALPTLPVVKSISSGAFHTCAVTAAGEAYCWGAGGQGQLGNGSYTGSLAPVRVSGTTRFSRISAGAYHTCALGMDGLAFCWGQNNLGQLGNGTLNNVAAPVPVNGGLSYRTISSGAQHSCAVAASGQAFCWGASHHGELGTALVQPGPGSVDPSGVYGDFRFSDISAGTGFTCAVAVGGSGWCWGRGLDGQLGTGQVRNWATPQAVSDGQINATPLRFARISATGTTHACGLTEAKAIYCWGRGAEGQLGNPSTSFTALATRVRTQ